MTWCSSPSCMASVSTDGGRLFVIIEGRPIRIDVCIKCKRELLKDKERAREVAREVKKGVS